MKSINQFMALMFCLFVGTSMLLVAGICAADETNYYYYSNQGNNLDHIMYMQLDLGDYTAATLSFSTRYYNEPGDFAVAFCSTNLTPSFIGIEYLNGTQSEWTTIHYDLSYYTGTKRYVGFNYQTDGSGVGEGFYVDNILITGDGEIIFDDDGTNNSWKLDGFTRESDAVQDTTPPVIDQPLDIWIEQNATGNITWVITETYPDKYWVLRDSTEEIVSPKSYESGKELKVQINASDLEVQKYIYTIFANDKSGNESSDQVNITVQTQAPPKINITSPNSGHSTTSDSVTISGYVNGTGSTPKVTVNEKPAEFTPTDGYAGNFSVSVSLTVGDNLINAIVTDAAGLTGNASITVTRKKVSSGGGGGGGGTSGEEYKNIEVSETEREYVNKDSKVSYSFDMEGNIISYINFTGKTSSGRIAAKIDTLKDTSTLVDHAPQGKVFKNMGIYVGNLGWASPNNIANPTIRFIVHKSWVNENNIDKSTIRLNRYSDGKWDPLETDLIDEDQNSLHFESKTPGFSQFAVTGTEASAAQGGEGGVVEKPTIVVERKEPVTEQTPDEKDTGIPGFSLLTGFTIMLVVVQLLRRKK